MNMINYSRLIEHSLNGHVLGYDFDKIGLESGFSITNAVSNGGKLDCQCEFRKTLAMMNTTVSKTYNDYKQHYLYSILQRRW